MLVTSYYALVCHYALVIIATWELPRSLKCCAQYTLKATLRQTGSLCCHDN